MKLSCIAPAHPYRGGIAHFGVRLAQELAHSNDCDYINFSLLYPEFLFPGKTQYDTSESTVSFPSERMINSVNPFSWLKTSRHIKANRADALIFHWWHPFFAPAYQAIIRTAPKASARLAICHNVLPHDKGAMFKHAIKFGLAGFDGYVVHGDSERDDLLRLFPKAKILKLFHPIYDIFSGEDTSKAEARQRLGISLDTRMILYFGLIRPYKGVDTLLKALPMLSEVDRLKCYVVGEVYSGKEELEMLMAKLPAERATLVDSYIPNESVSDWFRACDLVVLPYRSATQSGIIPIAYRCGRPVVATKVGALPDVVKEGETGYLVEPNDPEALADAIRRYFIDLNAPDLTENIARQCDNLSWARYSEELTAFIEELRHG